MNETGTFTLTIELGNEAMQTPRDLAWMLRDIADKIENEGTLEGTARDENGNTCATYNAAQ